MSEMPPIRLGGPVEWVFYFRDFPAYLRGGELTIRRVQLSGDQRE